VADVKIGPSPAWLAGRLEAAGVRPISNLVDITNYVLIELGHPMHAFDLTRIGGAALRIRRAVQGEGTVQIWIADPAGNTIELQQETRGA